MSGSMYTSFPSASRGSARASGSSSVTLPQPIEGPNLHHPNIGEMESPPFLLRGVLLGLGLAVPVCQMMFFMLHGPLGRSAGSSVFIQLVTACCAGALLSLFGGLLSFQRKSYLALAGLGLLMNGGSAFIFVLAMGFSAGG